MFAFLLFFVFLQPSVSVNQKVVSDVELQIDTQVQNILSDQQANSSYWFLTQMAESSEWIEHLIVNRINQVLRSPRSGLTTCFLNAFLVSSDSGRITARRLEAALDCRSDFELSLMLLYEYPTESRSAFVRQMGLSPPDSVASEALRKSLGQRYDAASLFTNREIRLSDFYLLSDYDPTISNGIHQGLVNAWKRDISENSTLTTPLDFVKLHVVISANHLLEDDFESNFQLLTKVTGNRLYPTTTQKHVQYKRLVFAASAYGYYQIALNFYRNDLLPLSEAIMPEQDYLTVRMDYSSILFRIGNIVNALSEFKDLYKDIEKFTDVRYKSSLLNNLAVSYLNAGYFDQYISLQLEAYELAQQLNSFTYQLQILNNLFLYYKNLGSWDSAIMYLDQAEKLALQGKLNTELANIRILKAIYQRDYVKNNSLTIQLLETLSKQLEKDQNFRELAVLLSELAITYEFAGNYEGILRTRQRIQLLATERADVNLQTENLISLALQQFKFNKLAEAEKTISSLSSLQIENVEFRLRAQFAHVHALSLYHKGQITEAIHLLSDLVPELTNRIKFSGNIQTGTIYIERYYRQIYGFLADLYLENGNSILAAELLDEFKTLNKTTFLNSQMLKSSVLTEDELLLDMRLNTGIERLRSKLYSSNDSTRLSVSNQLAQLQDEQNRLFNKILQNTSSNPVSIEYVSSSLKKDETIIAFTAIDSIVYITNINKENVTIDRKILSNNDIVVVQKAYNGLQLGNPDIIQLSHLYKKFLQNSFEKAGDKVIVIPDAFLYKLPVEIMPVTKPKSPFAYGSVTYIIEEHSVSYSNSIDDYTKSSQRRLKSGYNLDFLGFGVSNFNNQNLRNVRTSLSPLPFAVNEVQESATILNFNGNSRVFIEDDATRGNLYTLASESRIVHIASHSEVNPVDPLFSQIYLSDEASGSISSLYAYELFNLSLDTELMVLSSCDSGSGSYSEGSGIIGLGRALNFAGAQSLILNSWSIRDKTASDIMISFYRNLASGFSKDESLRQAKISYINHNNSNPAVWGSLILFGNPDPIIKKADYYLYLIVGLILLVIISGIVIGKKYYFIKSR